MLNVTYYYLNSTQNNTSVPVIVEQMGLVYPYVLDKQGLEILPDTYKEAYKAKLNIPGMKYSRDQNTYTISINHLTLWQMFSKFRSKQKGIVKFRKIFTSDNDDILVNEQNTLYAYTANIRSVHGIMWSLEVLEFGLAVLQDHLNRWTKLKAKLPLKEALAEFYRISVGSTIAPENELFKIYAHLCVLEAYVYNLQSKLTAYKRTTNPTNITKEIFNSLFCVSTFSIQNGGKNNFRLGRLGYLFKDIKAPLGDLMSTFTDNTIERKFLAAKIPGSNNGKDKKKRT